MQFYSTYLYVMLGVVTLVTFIDITFGSFARNSQADVIMSLISARRLLGTVFYVGGQRELPKYIRALHGLRFFIIFCVILVHSLMFQIFYHPYLYMRRIYPSVFESIMIIIAQIWADPPALLGVIFFVG